MIDRGIERDVSPAEREFMHDALQSSPTGTRRLMRGAGNALVLWAAFCLVLFVALRARLSSRV